MSSVRHVTRQRLPKIDLTRHCRDELEKFKNKDRKTKTERDSRLTKKPIHGRVLSERVRVSRSSEGGGEPVARLLSGREYDGFRGVAAPKHFKENFNNLTFRLVERIKPFVH